MASFANQMAPVPTAPHAQEPRTLDIVSDLLDIIKDNSSSSSSDIAGKIAETIKSKSESLTKTGQSAFGHHDRAELLCEAAATVFGSEKVVRPTSATYEGKRTLHWSELCWLPAACYVHLSSAPEVALALKMVTAFQSTFVVRGRGHNANQTFASVGARGVVLDITGIDEVTVSENAETVTVGGGATWDAVYEHLNPYGKAVAGGRGSGIGVAGLLSGGGMSHFTNAWGFACDSVNSFELVTSDSKIVRASHDENPDLFKALKGGATNFGIITEVTLQTKPGNKLWTQMNLYDNADQERIVQAAVKIEQAMAINDRLGYYLLFFDTYTIAGLLYRGDSEGMPAEFSEALQELEPLQIVQPARNGTFFDSVTQTLADKQRRAIGTLTVETDAALYSDFLDEVKATAGMPFAMMIALQPIHGGLTMKQSEANGGSIPKVDPVLQSFVGIVVQWKDDAVDEQATAKCHDVISRLHIIARKHGKLLKFKFVNDSSYIQDPLSTNGPESVEFLRTVAKKYDSQQVFQTLQNGGFKITKAQG